MKDKYAVSDKQSGTPPSGISPSGVPQPETDRTEAAKPAVDQQDSRSPTLNPFQVMASVFAAGLGVQSSRNRERDFKQGRAPVFIVAGLLFTLAFIGVVYGVVQLVLRSAGT